MPDNSHLPEKLALRRAMLDRFHAEATGASPVSVFDACQGRGVMWAILRAEYPCRYWGVDVKPGREQGRPGRLRIDSARVLEQAGWDFEVIDVDTYGSPWRHWEALLPRVTKAVTVFLTIGVVRAGGAGGLGKAATRAAGLTFRRLRLPPSLAGGLRRHCEAAALALALDPPHNLKVELALEVAMPPGARMRYMGLRLVPPGTRVRKRSAGSPGRHTGEEKTAENRPPGPAY